MVAACLSSSLSSLLDPSVSADLMQRPKLGVLPLGAIALFGLWLVLLRVGLPGLGRRLFFALCALSALTVLLMLPRVLWRHTGAPTRFISSLHGYLLAPMTVMQVTMLAGLFSAPVWVPLGLYVRRKLRRGPEPGQKAKPQLPNDTTEAPKTAQAAAEPRNCQPDNLQRTPPSFLHRPIRLSRRQLLQALPWVVPGGAFAAAHYGVLWEANRIVLRRVRLVVPGLPKTLSGFRIGQVTDVHISRFQTQLAHLEQGLQLLAQEKLDVLCATGDLCDEPRLHLPTLRLIKQVPTRLGHIACAGNHELYLARPTEIRRAYDQAGILLLEEDSVSLGGLQFGGVGFSHSKGLPRFDAAAMPRRLDQALRDHDPKQITVLLAHHPQVFRHHGPHRIDLQLSGHTHGGQVGLLGWSPLETAYPLIRGHYTSPDGREQLFVSAGLGHWLPFRMGCPPEVVVFELL